MVSEELKEAQGAEAGFSAQLKDPSAETSFNRSRTVIGTVGMIQEGRAVLMSLLKTSFPFVESLSRDTEPFTGQGDVT